VIRRVAALTGWAYLAWLLLTWTRTLEQQLAGLALALALAVLLAPLGDVAAPWRLLERRRLLAVARLAAVSFGRIVMANIDLARRVWSPSRPLHTAMVIVPTTQRTDGGLTATGLITSLIVGNQVVDVDRRRHELQYHVIDAPHGNRKHPEEDINAPIERLIDPVVGR